ncbi:MAG: hypothetical protein IT337_01725 [Thermomicrobiales bacterium]|nr:hypothetical protein [Thermomicrobiales bacterium]
MTHHPPIRRRAYRLVPVLLVLALLVSGLTPLAHAVDDHGVDTIVGDVTVTSPFIGKAFSQPFMQLTDLTAFVKRDLLMPLPTIGQISANITGDFRDKGRFTIPLPIRPIGQDNDLDGGGPGAPVQLFAVDFTVNLVGDPSLGPLEYTGWPSALSSLDVAIGTNEVRGGRMVIWSSDDDGAFPTGFGPDGKLFTDDDPMGAVPAGWTVIDLDQIPFALDRSASVNVPILEGDIGLRDLSDRTYTEAFDALVDELAARYPYTAFKGIDWDALSAEFRPAIERAEAAQDKEAFNVALMRFAVAIGDGHVSVDPPDLLFGQQLGGNLGLALGQTDDGAIIVRCVTAKGPAKKAGIEPGARIIAWDGAPVAEALAAVDLVFSKSTELGLRDQRLWLLPRQPVGAKVAIAFANPGEAEQTAALRAAKNTDGFNAPCGIAKADPAEMPVTTKVLPSGIGYIKVNAFSEDLTLTLHAWEWALRRLRKLEAPALILDIRTNGGGLGKLPLYMAGSFTSESFVLANEVYVAENGERVVSGIDRIDPAPVRWKKPVAVLIGPECVSACELLAAAIAHDPARPIVGLGPTAGVEGGVFSWNMPGNIPFHAPLIGFEDSGGDVFLEGSGVQPTIRVPNTVESLMVDPAAADPVLETAVRTLTERTDTAEATPVSGVHSKRTKE